MLVNPKKDTFIDVREKAYEEKFAGTAIEAPKMASPPPPRKGPTFYIRDVKLPFTMDDVMVTKTAKIQFKLRNIESGVNYDNKPRDFYELEVIGISL